MEFLGNGPKGQTAPCTSGTDGDHLKWARGKSPKIRDILNISKAKQFSVYPPRQAKRKKKGKQRLVRLRSLGNNLHFESEYYRVKSSTYGSMFVSIYLLFYLVLSRKLCKERGVRTDPSRILL